MIQRLVDTLTFVNLIADERPAQNTHTQFLVRGCGSYIGVRSVWHSPLEIENQVKFPVKSWLSASGTDMGDTDELEALSPLLLSWDAEILLGCRDITRSRNQAEVLGEDERKTQTQDQRSLQLVTAAAIISLILLICMKWTNNDAEIFYCRFRITTLQVREKS